MQRAWGNFVDFLIFVIEHKRADIALEKRNLVWQQVYSTLDQPEVFCLIVESCLITNKPPTTREGRMEMLQEFLSTLEKKYKKDMLWILEGVDDQELEEACTHLCFIKVITSV